MNHIVILGGGFAGIEAAIQLRKKSQNVTLISNREFLFIYPLSIWIPVKLQKYEKTCLSLRDVAAKYQFNFVIGDVQSIDAKNSKVMLRDSDLSYDYLVIALGGKKYPINGIEHTHSIADEPEKSLILQQGIDRLIQQGHGRIAVGFGGNPHDSSAVRGGPAFELIFNIHRYLKKRNLLDKFELTFFAPMQNPGIRLGEKASIEVFRMLNRLNITCHFGNKIHSFSEKTIQFDNGKILEFDLITFISARNGHPVLQNSDIPLSAAGFIKIDDHCQVIGFPRVYAIGDTADLQGPDWKAKQGHLAEAMAKTAAHNIVGQINNNPRTKQYLDDISIICLMDMGNSGALVYRNHHRQWLIPLPIIGHWFKRLWGKYYVYSKLGRIPRIPGL